MTTPVTTSLSPITEASLMAMPERDVLKQPAVLLLGEPGAGKTYSAATIAKRKKLFCLFTEPGGEESLIEGCMAHKIPIKDVHWHYVSPSSTGWEGLMRTGTLANMLSYKDLGEQKNGIEKDKHRQFLSVMGVLADFTCQRTGESFGPVDKFDESCALFFDSLSGLNDMAKELVVGGKPTLHQGEWGVAMQIEMTLIKKIVYDTRCLVAITGHVDKLIDEVAGRMTFQVSLLGNKLAPAAPRIFSDVIWCYRDNANFYWSTLTNQIGGLKGRNFGLADKIPQDFARIMDKYEARVKYIRGAQ